MGKNIDFFEKCIYCSSKNIYVVQIRKNINSEKEIFRCRECKRRFCLDDGFKKFRSPPIVIKTTLKLLEDGLSLSQIVYYLNQNFRIKVSRKTILDWKRKFIK